MKEVNSARFQIKTDFVVSILDSYQQLLRFNNQADFLPVWLKETSTSKVNSFDFSDGLQFKYGIEVPIVLVKISVSMISCKYGESFRNRFSYITSSFCHGCDNVEVDLRNSLPDQIWIGIGHAGFWQQVTYIKLSYLLLFLPKRLVMIRLIRRR